LNAAVRRRLGPLVLPAEDIMDGEEGAATCPRSPTPLPPPGVSR